MQYKEDFKKVRKKNNEEFELKREFLCEIEDYTYSIIIFATKLVKEKINKSLRQIRLASNFYAKYSSFNNWSKANRTREL